MNFVRIGRSFISKCPRIARHGLKIGSDGLGFGYLRGRDLISVEPNFPKFFSCKAAAIQRKEISYDKRGSDIETHDEEQLTGIKDGDIVNLPGLLFTKKRDYLVKYNAQKVKAEQLVGKDIVLYFVTIHDVNSEKRAHTTFLIDIYNDLLPANNFEVIFVAVDDPRAKSHFDIQTHQKNFEIMFARMPWTAIPFSDKASRERIARRFGIFGGKYSFTSSAILDSKGLVLKDDACYLFGDLFGEYGTPGYPFTDERIKFLDAEDDAVAKQPSLESLLGSPERDYLISNKNDRVPIHTLKDKVIALFFYEGDSDMIMLTRRLKMTYKKLAKENFEVVLLYLYDTRDTACCTNEESFWKIFKTMPWLALPFKDPTHKRLKRIFGYPYDLDGPERAPRLVIIGPNVEFVDSCGACVLMNFGPPSCTYPFTRRKLAKLETEMIKELKLEMLWDPNTCFRVKKDGLEIPFSQYLGKRVLICFEMTEADQRELWDKFLVLKDLYLKMKGTDDEFEVIFIKDSSSTEKPYGQWVTPDYGELPWVVHYYDKGYSLPKELEHIFYFNYFHYSGKKKYESCLLVAFDCDGRIVRKTFYPKFRDTEFPFYAGGLEEEYLHQLNYHFGWYYWDTAEKERHVIYQRG